MELLKCRLSFSLSNLSSLPIPTPCCTDLLEAQRMEVKEAQIKAMHIAVAETFPEPNRRLLQRVLKMMRTVAAHASENRMTTPAVAACMAPLLLRPLLTDQLIVSRHPEAIYDKPQYQKEPTSKKAKARHI